MSKLDIDERLELYSNAILGFFVFQGLAFLYQFGTNTTFRDTIKGHASMSWSLIMMFACALVGALWGNNAISHALQQRVDPADQEVVRKVFYGKAVVLFLFGSMPVYFVALYGLIQVGG